MTKTNIVIGEDMSNNKDITITKQYVGEVDFVSGIRGSGKTYCSGVIEEQMCESEWPFIVIDPLGIHCSLRDVYDNVVIIGGKYGDGDSINTIRDCIESRINVVVDLSEFDSDHQQILCKEICEIIKEVKPGPLKVIIEECDIFVPQRGGNKECKEIITYLVRKYRMHGIGMMLICQRFASVSKEVVTQVDNYMVFRSRFNSDVVELKKLFAKPIVDKIKVLEAGECYMDSGHNVGFVKFNERECMHLGNTPVLGEDEDEFVPCELNSGIFEFLDDSIKGRLSITQRIKNLF